MRSVNITTPTRSLLRIADIASTARELRRDLALEAPTRAESLRARHVDGEHHRELALLDVALDERALHARRDVPVDAAHLVARLILAHLGELHSLPLEHRAVLAGEERVHEPARAQLEQLDLAQHLGRHGRRAACGRRSAARARGGCVARRARLARRTLARRVEAVPRSPTPSSSASLRDRQSCDPRITDSRSSPARAARSDRS